MKRNVFLVGWVVIIWLFVPSCKKSGQAPEASISAAVTSEIDEATISSSTGVAIKVLKAESIGISPNNRFYWIRVQGKPEKTKLLNIARAILDEVIAAKPKLYHSFTLHFISSVDFQPGTTSQKCFANATFLPEGDWQKVGRIPIDSYANYKLDCVIGE